MEKSDGLRRNQVMQQEAREILMRFLSACSPFIPKAQRTHFRNDFPKTAKTAEVERKSHESLVRRTVGRIDKLDKGVIDEIFQERLNYAACFMRILQVIAEGQLPTKADLSILRDALNLPFGALMYFPEPIRQQLKKDAYDREYVPDIREAGEALRAYLNLSERYGAVHTSCQTCGLLMIKKRGGRKYCSQSCSKAAWSYQKRKDKLAENRELHKQRIAREKQITQRRGGR